MRFKNDSQSFGLCDYKGNIIVPNQYFEMYPMGSGGLIMIGRNDQKGITRYGLMDYDGNVLLDSQYDSLWGNPNQRLLYARAGIFSGLIDTKGNWVWHTSAYDSLED